MANFLEHGSLPDIPTTCLAKSPVSGALPIILRVVRKNSEARLEKQLAGLAVKSLARIKIKLGKCSEYYPFWEPLTPHYCGHSIKIMRQAVEDA
jgi:hypothetical protein